MTITRGSTVHDLPDTLHTNEGPDIFRSLFSPLINVSLDMDSGTFNSSKTDEVETVNLMVAVSQHRGTSVEE